MSTLVPRDKSVSAGQRAKAAGERVGRKWFKSCIAHTQSAGQAGCSMPVKITKSLLVAKLVATGFAE